MDLSSLSNTFSNVGNIAGGLTSGLGAIGALGSFLGLGDSGPSYSEQLAMQYEYQLKAMMQQYQNQMNLQQSANTHQTYLTNLNQKLQKELLQVQQKYQSAEWLSQFNTQAKYNSPSAQVARLRGAGFNPSAMLGSQGAGAAGNSSMGAAASAPSAPSVGSPSVPMGSANALGVTPSYYDFDLKRKEGLKALQEIARTSKELGYFDERSRAEIDSIWQNIQTDKSQQNLNEAAQANYEIETELKRTHGHSKIKSEIYLLQAQTYANMAAGDLDAMETNFSRWKGLRESEEYKKIVEENKVLAQKIQKMIDLLDKQIEVEGQKVETEKSMQASNYAAAEEHKAGAREKNAQAENLEFYNLIRSENRDFIVSQVISEAEKAAISNRIDKQKVALIKELTHKFKNENDWFVANQILDRIQQIAGDVIDLKRIEVAGMPTETVHSESTSVSDNSGYRSTTTKKSSNLRKKRH